jgi:hypothetical protein
MRRIVVLEEAAEDIERGRKFCDLQEIGVGDFFEDTILSDTESLGLFHGIHADILDSIACYGKISVRNLLPRNAQCHRGFCGSGSSQKSGLDSQGIEKQKVNSISLTLKKPCRLKKQSPSALWKACASVKILG